MTLHDISHDTPADSGQNAPAAGEQLAREQALKQIERKRRFRFWAMMGTLVMIIVTVSWAFSEYHNAGGWPTQGFSDSSGRTSRGSTRPTTSRFRSPPSCAPR